MKVRNLSAVPDIIAELGADLASVLADAGLERNILSDPENMISYVALGRLVQACVRTTGCDHFGLLVGMRQSSSVLGLAGYVAVNAPTVREALETIIASLRLSDTGGRVSLGAEKGFASLNWIVSEPGIEAVEHIDDAAIAVACNLVRAVRGEKWRATEVCLTRRRPKNIAPYVKFYNAPIRFETDCASLLFEETHLDQNVAGRDAALHRLLSPFLQKELATTEQNDSERIRNILRVQLFNGPLTPERVASALGISSRTLARRLAAENVTFSELAQQVRSEAAQKLLRTEKSISEIAATLGYSDSTAFIRAFKLTTGTTPARWRRAAN